MSKEDYNKSQKKVKYFDIKEQIMPGATIEIIGKRASGKSNLLYEIMSETCHFFDYGMSYTPTQSSRQKMLATMPEQFVHPPDIPMLETFIRNVNVLYDKAIEQGKKPKNAYLICDDCAFDKQFMQSKPLNEVFLNGRNFNITCILVLQYLKNVGPALRQNADFVFVFWNNNEDVQRDIYKYWFSQMGSFKLFKEVFEDCTVDYAVLVLDVRRSAVSRDWHDCVYWYKAKESQYVDPFIMCNRDFFKLSEYCKPDNTFKNSHNDKKCWRLLPNGNLLDSHVPNKFEANDDDSDDE